MCGRMIRSLRKKILRIFGVIILAVFLFFSVTVIEIYRTGGKDERQNVDAIVILGSAEYAGKPSPVFKARLDHGADLYKEGYAPSIIVAGGQDEDETYSEAGVGKAYLVKQKKIPQEKIIAEEYSLTTVQNISRLKDHAQAQGLKKVLLVSDPFHMFRAKWLAKKWGIEVYTSPTQTSPISENHWLEFKFVMREAVAFTGHLFFGL